MPAVSSPAHILVTGASGYIANWVMRTLLEQGYSVRVTYRNLAKAEYLKTASWSKKFFEEGKIEVVVVEDIVTEGAFNEAVQDVDGILHLASPFHTRITRVSQLVDPAVNGTLGILTSAYKYGNRIQRIVITSSCGAVLSDRGYPQVFDERHWNDQVIEEIGRIGDETPAMNKYRASKVLAERAAWKWYWAHRDEIKFDMVVLNLPFVFGPTIQPITSPFLLGESASALFNTLLIPGFRSREDLLLKGSSWVDVRDVGVVHVRALKRQEASEERIIVSSGPFVWQEWVDIANSIQPCPVPFHAPFPKGFPLRGVKPDYWFVYNTDKSAKLLHVGSGRPLNEDEERDWYPLRTMEETCRDFLDECNQKGW